MVRCPACGALVSEWAAVCGRCGADVGDQPLIASSAASLPAPTPASAARLASPFGRLASLLVRLRRGLERRSRGRTRRVVALIGAVLVLVAGVTAWRTSGGHPAGSVPRVANLTSFVPSVRHHGGVALLAVTLLDGRRVELRYPSSLAIAQLGLTLGSEMRWPAAAGCCWTRVSASHATAATAYGTAVPLETYPGPGGNRVGLFDAVHRRLPSGIMGRQNLVFHFSGWLVEVDTSAVGADGGPPEMSDQDRRMWAANLRASSAPGGYMVLQPRAPLALAPTTFGGRMSATFGLGRPNEPQANTLDIEDGYCEPLSPASTGRSRFRTGDGLLGVAWCDAASGLYVSAVGLARFVDDAARQLTMSVIRPAGR
jgi:hypothetical protein